MPSRAGSNHTNHTGGTDHGERVAAAIKEVQNAAAGPRYAGKTGGDSPSDATSPTAGEASTSSNGAVPSKGAGSSSAAKERPPHTPRKAGYIASLYRGRNGFKNGSVKDVRRSAALVGTALGHASATGPGDLALLANQQAASAHERAAIFARLAMPALEEPAKRYVTALKALDQALDRLKTVDADLAETIEKIKKSEERSAEFDAKVLPRAPAPRTQEEIDIAVASEREVSPALRAGLVVASLAGGGVEMFYSGSFSSDAGALGLPLPQDVNLMIPWIVGFALGVVIVQGAAIAGRVANRVKKPRNPASAPWFRSRCTELWIGAVASFATLRAVYSLVEDGFGAGALALAVGGIMTTIAVVSAAGGAELDRQKLEIADAKTRTRLLDEEREAKHPPSREEHERDAELAYLAQLKQRAATQTAERDRLRETADFAETEKNQAAVSLRSAEAAAHEVALQEEGLATQAINLAVQRADLVARTYEEEPADCSTRDPRNLRFEAADLGSIPYPRARDVVPGFDDRDAEGTEKAEPSRKDEVGVESTDNDQDDEKETR